MRPPTRARHAPPLIPRRPYGRAHILGPTPLLTRREMDVLDQVCLGGTNRQIAQHLALGVQTVKSYLFSARCKLDALDRSHAAALWIRLRPAYEEEGRRTAHPLPPLPLSVPALVHPRTGHDDVIVL